MTDEPTCYYLPTYTQMKPKWLQLCLLVAKIPLGKIILHAERCRYMKTWFGGRLKSRSFQWIIHLSAYRAKVDVPISDGRKQTTSLSRKNVIAVLVESYTEKCSFKNDKGAITRKQITKWMRSLLNLQNYIYWA